MASAGAAELLGVEYLGGVGQHLLIATRFFAEGENEQDNNESYPKAWKGVSFVFGLVEFVPGKVLV